MYEGLYQHYRWLYFGIRRAGKGEFGQVLPALIQVARAAASPRS